MTSFAEALIQGKLIILDGAMGTQLAARGALQGPVSNLEFPEVVKAVHADYVNAGVDAILTNTLTANHIALEHARLAQKVEDINRRGAEMAREVAGDRCYVLGDMSSTGKFLEPLGEYSEEQFYENAAEQAGLLAEGGVDGLIVETMTDVREACIAVKAARETTGLPVIASISFDLAGSSFKTMMGDTVEKAVASLLEAGADAVGSNCGTLDPIEMSRLIAEARSYSTAILAAQPNAGKPELSAGEAVFRLTPQEFADGMVKCVEAGAMLIGGCCGTTPAHIAEVVNRLK